MNKRKAEQALVAVKDRYKAYIGAGYAPPTLYLHPGGRWRITWEEGPFEWAYRAVSGGVDEELAALRAEFGMPATEEQPITWPAGVGAEPYYSFELVLYEED